MSITSIPEFAGGPVRDFMLAGMEEAAKNIVKLANEGPGTYEENLAAVKQEVLRKYEATFGEDAELVDEDSDS